ncbi:MAG TPA: GPW/gp25 family protein [Anaerolineae bacterium]|nr:GPW/gp25 family protein [Anaerolineae bacterium]
MAPSSTKSYVAQTRSLYGAGPAFPPRVDAAGRLAWSTGEDNVRQSIRILLLTEPGERLMREEFGCGLRRFLFEPNTPATRQLIQERITRAIARWEPRAAVEAVQVEPDLDDARTVHISITFRLVATQALQRLGLSLQLEG